MSSRFDTSGMKLVVCNVSPVSSFLTSARKRTRVCVRAYCLL